MSDRNPANKSYTKLPNGFQIVNPNGNGKNTGNTVPIESFQVSPEVYRHEADDAYVNLAGDFIKQAVRELMLSDPAVRQKALAWLLDDDERPPSVAGGITFRWICNSFNVEATYLLRKLRREATEKTLKKSKKKMDRLRVFLSRLEGFIHTEDYEWALSEARRLKFKEPKESKNE